MRKILEKHDNFILRRYLGNTRGHDGTQNFFQKNVWHFSFNLRDTLFKTEKEIGAGTLALHFIATEIGHKNMGILLKLAEIVA